MRRRSKTKSARNLFAPASEPKRTIVGIKVKFELNSKNGLRRVIFGLEKNSQGDDILWKINFALFERDKKSDPYSDALVDMDVEVDTQLNKKAEDTAHKGLTPGQAAHALGPAAEAGEGHHRADVGASMRQLRSLGGGVEILALQPDGRHDS